MNAPAPALLRESIVRLALLPEFLLRPVAVLWLWLLPVGLMFALNLQAFGLVEGNMDAEQRARMELVSIAGLVNLGLGLTLFLGLRRRHGRAADARGAWLARAFVPIAVQ